MTILYNMSRLMTKPIKWLEHPAKIQISLGICPVWSKSSPSAWRNLWSLAIHWAHSEDQSDWPDTQADLSLRWAQSHFAGFVMRRLNYVSVTILCMTLDFKSWWSIYVRDWQIVPKFTTKNNKNLGAQRSWCNYPMMWTMCFYRTTKLM